MWVLLLNDMRASNIENICPVCRAATKEQLLAYLAKEKVEPYTDEKNGYKWGKTYRKGGPLEWYNSPYMHDEHLHFKNAGHEDEWAANARRSYQERVGNLPLAE